MTTSPIAIVKQQRQLGNLQKVGYAADEDEVGARCEDEPILYYNSYASCLGSRSASQSTKVVY